MEFSDETSLLSGPGRRAEDRKSGTNSFYSASDSEISRRRSAGIPKQPNQTSLFRHLSGREERQKQTPDQN